MIWRANDSERDSEPFSGFGLRNQQKILHFKGANTTNGRQLQRKEIWFHLFVEKEQNNKAKKIKRSRHTEGRLECENRKSINRAPFRVSAVI